ncbi:MAG: hypothetical protein JSS43_21850 [Proteobacteria bacterium]|nr:hypothetical protein [Pseudomonadota bacterium]
MRYFGILLAATALAAGAGTAQADYVVGDTFNYGSYELMGGNVHVTDAPLGLMNQYVGAGAIKLKHGASSVWGFCIDLTVSLAGSGVYTFAPITAPSLSGNYAPGISKVDAIEAILQFAADVYGTNAHSQTLGNATQRSEAAQLAIWKIEYGAALSVTPDDTAVSAILASDLSQISSWVPLTTGAALQLRPTGRPNQPLISLDPPTAASEPDAASILGVALLALGCLVAMRRLRPGRTAG